MRGTPPALISRAENEHAKPAGILIDFGSSAEQNSSMLTLIQEAEVLMCWLGLSDLLKSVNEKHNKNYSLLVLRYKHLFVFLSNHYQFDSHGILSVAWYFSVIVDPCQLAKPLETSAQEQSQGSTGIT